MTRERFGHIQSIKEERRKWHKRVREKQNMELTSSMGYCPIALCDKKYRCFTHCILATLVHVTDRKKNEKKKPHTYTTFKNCYIRGWFWEATFFYKFKTCRRNIGTYEVDWIESLHGIISPKRLRCKLLFSIIQFFFLLRP